MMNKYLTKRQIAARFGVTPDTVGRWVRAGNFPAPLKIGNQNQSICRWPVEQVDEWAARLPHKRPFSQSAGEFIFAARRGRFPEAFAEYWSHYGVGDHAELERVGTALQRMFAVRGKDRRLRYERAQRALSDEISRLVKKLFADDRGETAKFFIDWLWELHCDFVYLIQGRGSVDDANLAYAFGAVRWSLNEAKKRGASVELDAIIKTVAKALEGDGIGETDVRRAIQKFTREVPLESWLTENQHSDENEKGGCRPLPGISSGQNEKPS